MEGHPNNPLLIRADASVSMGTGHIMRMIALAQAWQDAGGDAVFLCAETTPALDARLRQERFPVEKIQAPPGSREDLEATCAAIARHRQGSIPVALDGYQFGSGFQSGLKKTGCRLLAVDDYGHCAHYHADWVLNQNISADPHLYSNRDPQTELLLGTEFALLRREFLVYRGWQRRIPDAARKVLVTLGGSDGDNATGKVLESLAGLDLEVRAVVGGSNPNLPALRQTVGDCKSQSAKIGLEVNPPDMPQLMAWADFGVAAGGSTCWELAFMGLPSFSIVLAENQRLSSAELAEQKLFVGLGLCELESGCQQKFLELARDRSRRAEISQKCRRLVDGMGAAKICKKLKENEK